MQEIKPGYTRVSTVLSSIPSRSGTDPISGNPVWGFPLKNISPQILEARSQQGINVHEAIASFCRDGDSFFPLSDLEKGYFESFLKWKELVETNPIYIELRLYCDVRKITGCVDMVATLLDDPEPVVIDFKTSSVEDRYKWPIQGAFYSSLLSINELVAPKRALFVMLDREGQLPKVITYNLNNQVMGAASSALSLFYYLTRK